jgi:hypothetical protein
MSWRSWYWGTPIGSALLGLAAGWWVYVSFPESHPGVTLSWLVIPFCGSLGLMVGVITISLIWIGHE